MATSLAGAKLKLICDSCTSEINKKKLSSYHAANVRERSRATFSNKHTLSPSNFFTRTHFHIGSYSPCKAAQTAFLTAFLTAVSFPRPAQHLPSSLPASDLWHVHSHFYWRTPNLATVCHNDMAYRNRQRDTLKKPIHLLINGKGRSKNIDFLMAGHVSGEPWCLQKYRLKWKTHAFSHRSVWSPLEAWMYLSEVMGPIAAFEEGAQHRRPAY